MTEIIAIVGSDKPGNISIPSKTPSGPLICYVENTRPEEIKAIEHWSSFIRQELLTFQDSSKKKKKRGIGYTKKSSSKRK